MDHKNKIITDKEANGSIKSLGGGKMLPATEFLGSYSTDCTKADLVNNNRHSSQITAAELRLLKAIVENPMHPSSEYPRLARISPNTFQKLRPVLIDKGFIREHKLQSGGRGRSTMLLEPLDLAKKIVADNANHKGSC
jgi:hypothetical protein